MTSIIAKPACEGLFGLSEEWRNTKAQRETLRAKFDGRCAYCGGEIGRVMHADHVEPSIRITTDQWSRPLPASERRLLKLERNTVANMMPACAPCNLHKGGYPLEDWRAVLQRSADIVRRQTSTFRAGERFGVIAVSDAPVTFYFERYSMFGKSDSANALAATCASPRPAGPR